MYISKKGESDLSNVENEIFKTIEDNDLITAKSLLKHHEQELSNHATYYFLQICFYIKKKNTTANINKTTITNSRFLNSDICSKIVMSF